MPLHTTGLVSRHNLHHPEDKPKPKIAPPDFVRVLKRNPYHDKTGAFTSKDKAQGGGGQSEQRSKGISNETAAAVEQLHAKGVLKPGPVEASSGGGGGGASTTTVTSSEDTDLMDEIDEAEDDLEDAAANLEDARSTRQDLADDLHSIDQELHGLRDKWEFDEESLKHEESLNKARADLHKELKAATKAYDKAADWHDKMQSEVGKLRDRINNPSAKPAKSGKTPEQLNTAKAAKVSKALAGTDAMKAAKALGLPGGKGIKYSTAQSYEWSQRGGHPDSTKSKALQALKDAGFEKADTTSSSTADGSHMGHGARYVKAGWSATIDSSYGNVAADNWHTITLRKT